jgi:hypothetical protein
MAIITAKNELAATLGVEFDGKLYFRIEIFRVDKGPDTDLTTYFAEVYQLRLPNGTMAFPKERSDRGFRQSCLFFEDFPLISGSSVNAVHDETLQKLSTYADNYCQKFDPELKRSQPGR